MKYSFEKILEIGYGVFLLSAILLTVTGLILVLKSELRGENSDYDVCDYVTESYGRNVSGMINVLEDCFYGGAVDELCEWKR